MLLIVICLILAALCAAYGASVASIKSGSSFYMVWFAACAGFVLLALCRRLGLWGRLNHVVRGILISAAVAVLAVFLAVEGIIAGQFFKPVEPGLDYIIVLGAQVRDDGPSVVLLRRLEKAAEYLQANPDTVCIVTGGQGANEPVSEADAMAEWLENAGIDSARILRETEAANTLQNIRRSMALIPDPEARVGIVTNSFHIFRSVAIARKQGLAGAVGIPATSYPFYLPNNMLREFFGVLKDFLAGNL